MNSQNRKQAIAAYKDRKPAYGLYAVICNATGQVWVGISRHVDTQQNGLWFALRQGNSLNKTLQAAWISHGEGEFRFEELDRLSEDYSELTRMDELKQRQKLWLMRLQARSLL